MTNGMHPHEKGRERKPKTDEKQSEQTAERKSPIDKQKDGDKKTEQ